MKKKLKKRKKLGKLSRMKTTTTLDKEEEKKGEPEMVEVTLAQNFEPLPRSSKKKQSMLAGGSSLRESRAKPVQGKSAFSALYRPRTPWALSSVLGNVTQNVLKKAINNAIVIARCGLVPFARALCEVQGQDFPGLGLEDD